MKLFGAHTRAALADGTHVPIADVQVGDEVLAYDFDIDSTVGREVTATLPHTDWLLEAHFSDGTTMNVTEDHRFWSVADDDWVELQDLDTSDVLLSPDGATVTVDFLDWDAGVTTDAYDLTVDQEHNFFVTADATGEPVLVHNQTRGTFCGVRISSQRFLDSADELVAVEDALGPLADDVGDLLRRLTNSSSQATIDRVVDGLVAVSGSPTAVRQLGRNLLVDDDFLRTVPEISQELFGQVFTAVDIGSLPREARSLLVSSGTSSVDAIRLQDRFGIDIRPTTPWGPVPDAADTAAIEAEVGLLFHSGTDDTSGLLNRLEFTEESDGLRLDIHGERPPANAFDPESDPLNPECLLNGEWVDVISPTTFNASNALDSALQKVTVRGQTQRVVIALQERRTQVSSDALVAEWNSLIGGVADDGALGELLGFSRDPSRFPLEELLIVDLDGADPLGSVVRLFPRE